MNVQGLSISHVKSHLQVNHYFFFVCLMLFVFSSDEMLMFLSFFGYQMYRNKKIDDTGQSKLLLCVILVL